MFCYCGRVGKPQYEGKCERHRGKEQKKKEKQAKFRGDSKWQLENGMFTFR